MTKQEAQIQIQKYNHLIGKSFYRNGVPNIIVTVIHLSPLIIPNTNQYSILVEAEGEITKVIREEINTFLSIYQPIN